MPTPRKLRVAYLSGPIDGFAVFDAWSQGRALGYFGTSHLSQFFSSCDALDADAFVITTLSGNRVTRMEGRFLIENRPMPTHLSGLRYHLANAYWLLSLLPAVLRFRPDAFIVTAGQNYWFLLTFLRWYGIIIIPILTCTLWPKFAPQRSSLRILMHLNKLFYSRAPGAIVVASEDIADQIRTLTKAATAPINTFLSTYDREQFVGFRPAVFDVRPFNVFFAGRIETNKGIYDLVTIADRLEKTRPGQFHFHICGEGSELDNLRRRISEAGLNTVMTCHGFCERQRLSELLDASSVVIVPTTTQFEEGFNMVCAEAILAGRPLITSAVCPALAYVKDATVEVRPDDVDGYYQAILALAEDSALYEKKRANCVAAQEQFYDDNNSWGAKFQQALVLAGLSNKPQQETLS